MDISSALVQEEKGKNGKVMPVVGGTPGADEDASGADADSSGALVTALAALHRTSQPDAAPAPMVHGTSDAMEASAAGRASSGGGALGVACSWSPVTQRRYIGLSLEWALPADMDVESDSLRCCGANRFVAMALWRLACLRRYNGSVSFVRATGPGLETFTEQASQPLSGRDPRVATPPGWMTDEAAAVACGDAAAAAALAAQTVLRASGSDEVTGPLFSHLHTGGASSPADGASGAAKSDASPPAATEGWETYEGEFTYFWSYHMAHQSIDVSSAPFSSPSDGIIWLGLIRGRDEAGCCAVTGVLLDLDGHGSAMRHKCAELIPVRAFRLDPEAPKWQGHVAVDGEEVPYGPVQCEVHRGLGRLIGV
jgi:sphingosine kinase